MKIEGHNNPFVNSVFNVYVDVEGVQELLMAFLEWL